MQSVIRPARLVSRAPRSFLFLRPATQPARFAYSTYGNDQSGHQKDHDAPNPREDLEHPGPEAPASKNSSSNSTQSSSTGSSGNSKDKGSPAIHHPQSAAEKDSPEVRKHNEEMRQRSDQSVNQLSEDDNKVPPSYWKGDVGHKKEE